MYDEYHISEEDIQTIIRHLKIIDPKNADRDYAIQLIESMHEFGSNIARSDEAQAEAIQKALKKKKES